MSLRLNHSVDRLKPDKRAKENRFGGVQPRDPSKKGAARAEKTEPMMMMTSLFPFSSAFHSERDCHFFDMRPPRHAHLTICCLPATEKKILLPSNTPKMIIRNDMSTRGCRAVFRWPTVLSHTHAHTHTRTRTSSPRIFGRKRRMQCNIYPDSCSLPRDI
jgi:hypothetical protein